MLQRLPKSSLSLSLSLLKRYGSNGRVVVSSNLSIPSVNKSLPTFLLEKFTNSDINGLTAILDGYTNRSMTYNDVYESTYKFASILRKLGINKGTCVAIMSPNHIHYFTSFHAIALNGAYSTTVNPLYTNDELVHQLSVTKAKLIIAHPFCLEKSLQAGKQLGIPVISIDKVDMKDIVTVDNMIASEYMNNIDIQSFHANSKEFDNNDIATIPFSSGTTGKPKGVMLTHNNLVSNILQCMPYEGDYIKPKVKNDWNTRGTVLVPLPFFHIYGMVAGMCVPLNAGGKLILMPQFDMQKYLEIAQNHKVTRSYIVPPIILGLAKHPIVSNYDLSSLECLMSGAAPLGSDVQLMAAKRLNCLVKQAWGMTELSPAGTLSPDHLIKGVEEILGKSGILVAGTEGKIVDPVSGADLPYDVEGELLIRGPQVMKGYFNNADATSATIRADGWLHTGDIGKFDDNGWLIITDRCKELIKYKGFQVPPAELEAIILGISTVKDCVVIPVLDEEAGELPRAYVVKNDNAVVSEEDIIKYVENHVAPHKRLRGGVIFTDSIPKSASGKLLRRVQIQIDRESINK